MNLQNWVLNLFDMESVKYCGCFGGGVIGNSIRICHTEYKKDNGKLTLEILHRKITYSFQAFLEVNMKES